VLLPLIFPGSPETNSLPGLNRCEGVFAGDVYKLLEETADERMFGYTIADIRTKHAMTFKKAEARLALTFAHGAAAFRIVHFTRIRFPRSISKSRRAPASEGGEPFDGGCLKTHARTGA
jgi:hypothetical protein